jgi:hypothetical protein
MFIDVIVHLRPRTPNMGYPRYGLLTSEQPMLTVHVERKAQRSKEDTDVGARLGQGVMQSLVLGLRNEVFDPNIWFCKMKHR